MANNVEKIDAHIWSWRVYSIYDDYLSKRDEKSSDQLSLLTETPGPGYRLSIRIGNLPPEYHETRRKIAASMQAFLGYDREKFSTRDEFIDAIEDKVPVEPVPGNTWLSLELQKQVTLTDTGTRYLWNDMAECEAMLDGFKKERRSVFDAATAAIATVNSAWLDYPQVEPERIYIGGEGKEPTFVPRFEVGEPTICMQREWTDIPETASQDIGTATRALLGSRTRAITDPAGWLTAARRDASNALLRFMFAYVGLEMLATRFEDKKRKQTVDKLEELLHLPLKELIWPTPPDKSKDPSRNAMFNFALMAIALSDDPRKDIDTFSTLKATRDKLFHGSSDVDRNSLPARDIEQLLHRYLTLVARDEVPGTGGSSSSPAGHLDKNSGEVRNPGILLA